MFEMLKGVKVLDLTRLLPGAYATQLMGDMGAEILKVEDPWQGDYQRWGEPKIGENSVGFWSVNRNKKSMKLNLKSPEGKKILMELVKHYDILLEGFRPGVADKLGIDYKTIHAVNPKIVYCSISGYGQDGPYKLRPGHDMNYCSIAGMIGVTGHRDGQPLMPGVQVADVGVGGLMSVAGVLSAYISAKNTGVGQYIDISMMDGVVSWMTMIHTHYLATGQPMRRGRFTLNGGQVCYWIYKTKDGKYMSMGSLEEKFWEAFCVAAGREDLIPRAMETEKEGFDDIQALFSTRTQAEWIELLKDVDTCCEPVLDVEEVFSHPQVVARKMLVEVEHPTAGNVRLVANPIKMPYAEVVKDMPVPDHGQHTAEVLIALGYSDAEMAELKSKDVI
ncbi:MAG: CaiB/BaiF CoA transferase family protein [Bacillota bacterium]